MPFSFISCATEPRVPSTWVFDRDHNGSGQGAAQIRVCGEGNKVRLPPLAPEGVQLLDHYLRLERPPNCGGPSSFAGKDAHGTRMTGAGLRSLFCHHRQTTGVAKANPHRFRHYAA
jgi:site-specific recombinase XerD